MKQIFFFGECMAELRRLPAEPDATPLMAQSFAGDVYNSAVYLKRCFPNLESSLVTATGTDNLSAQMLTQFKTEQLQTRLVFQEPHKSPGLYLIETDDAGERSFVYWRSDSAARKVMNHIDDRVIDEISAGDLFFFSGISLAVVEEAARETFWQKLQTIKNAGVRIVFDPNYRARLWQSETQAKAEFEKGFAIADVALPGVEDLSQLYDVDTAFDALALLREFDVPELVIKNGPASVITVLENDMQEHHIQPVTNVVDTTSAGDAFNGVYLGARLSGSPLDEAVSLAASAAATVIQFPGAIIPKSDFEAAMSAML